MRTALLLLTLSLWWPSAHAAPDPRAGIPQSLAPWVDWVLYHRDQATCPWSQGSDRRHCAWPGPLALELSDAGGDFHQTWTLQAETWVTLPGDREHWPRAVRLEGEPTAVSQHAGLPALRLGPGRHRIDGEFQWRQLPESLAIPDATALLEVQVDGAVLDFPQRDRDGRLWLRGKGRKTTESERLELAVFRRLVDDNPARLVSRLELNVSGAARETTLGPVLPDGFRPLALDSPLPVRLEPDGRLRLQLRPGRWVIQLTGRHTGPLERVALATLPAPWPGQELWAFDARPALRLVELHGGQAVDPSQTRMPREWAKLPSYRLAAGEALELETRRRGDADPEPDRLTLNRELWLDFDGGGFSIRDTIQGSMSRGWRLETGDRLDLGQVRIDGQPRLITRLPDHGRSGVEVRRGQLLLSADSRYRGPLGALPVSGWAHDFQRVQADLHLPPGWHALAATGVDNRPGTWLQGWTLLDLFLVLITALALGRLWGWGWGLLGLLTLGLIWQEPEAPRLVWLNLLAATALLRVLPDPGEAAVQSRLHRLVLWYRRGSLLALVIIALPFLVAQVRTGLYPQLERPWQPMGTQQAGDGTASVAAARPTRRLPVERMMEQAEPMLEKLPSLAPMSRSRPVPQGAFQKQQQVPAPEPAARVQTGPGIPNWQWRSLRLAWNGPVEQGQKLGLWLLPPGGHLLLGLLRPLLVLLLGLQLAGAWPRLHRRGLGGAAALLPLILLPQPHGARAEAFPPPQLLEELETRLTAPPRCHPECADAQRMALTLAPDSLTLELALHALAETAVPLPGGQDWRPREVLLNGAPADHLLRDPEGTGWTLVPPGRQLVRMTGPLAARDRVALALPLRPHRAELAGSGWRVEGIDEQGVPDAQLQLVREREAVPGDDRVSADIPPFFLVQRTLRLGLDWRVETRVERRSPTDRPALVRVPLLAGESVVSDGVRVEGAEVLVGFAGGSTGSGWQSVLEPAARLELVAVQRSDLAESWRLDVGPQWHAALSGIPMVHRQERSGRWLPEWRPWPGERVGIEVLKPEAVEGGTLTLDASHLLLRPGSRSSDATLSLNLRSSLGGRHAITLPPDAKLLRVSIDERVQPIRQEGRQVTLPLVPGSQRVTLEWRAPGGMATRYRTPRLDLGVSGVNARTELAPPADRWLLLTGGPRQGPAVLFWGVLLVLLVLALGLGRVRLTPLRGLDWLLLGIGLSQVEIGMGLLVAGWLLALGLREQRLPDLRPLSFNLVQVGLAGLTLLALLALFVAVQQGLLGLPDMQVAGNGSSAQRLFWYQDRSGPLPPGAWVLSLPLWVYRLLMLAWALWLALRLLSWLRWGWGVWSQPVAWRRVRLTLPRVRKKGVPGAAATAERDREPEP